MLLAAVCKKCGESFINAEPLERFESAAKKIAETLLAAGWRRRESVGLEPGTASTPAEDAGRAVAGHSTLPAQQRRRRACLRGLRPLATAVTSSDGIQPCGVSVRPSSSDTWAKSASSSKKVAGTNTSSSGGARRAHAVARFDMGLSRSRPGRRRVETARRIGFHTPVHDLWEHPVTSPEGDSSLIPSRATEGQPEPVALQANGFDRLALSDRHCLCADYELPTWARSGFGLPFHRTTEPITTAKEPGKEARDTFQEERRPLCSEDPRCPNGQPDQPWRDERPSQYPESFASTHVFRHLDPAFGRASSLVGILIPETRALQEFLPLREKWG